MYLKAQFGFWRTNSVAVECMLSLDKAHAWGSPSGDTEQGKVECEFTELEFLC